MTDADFIVWLDSVQFVDEAGNTVTPPIGPDLSDDPEGDREGA